MARNRAGLPEDQARRGKRTTATGNAPNVATMTKEAQRTAGPGPLGGDLARVGVKVPAGTGQRGPSAQGYRIVAS